MPTLTLVATETPGFVPEPITAAEAAALFRACVRLFGLWGLTDAEAAVLLDMKPRTYARWKAEGPGDTGRDQRARLSNLMGIHKALRILFVEADRAYGWVKRPNDAFGGASALQVMLNGELTDLMRVRRLLDAERGGW